MPLVKRHNLFECRPNPRKRDKIRIYLADAFCRTGDLSNALKNIKGPADRWPDSAHIWNIFSRIILDVGGIRQTSKLISNLKIKHPNSVPICLMQGHVHLHNQAYEDALNEYLIGYKQNPSQPMISLCISNLYANYAGSRAAEDKDNAIVQAFAWMQEYSRRTSNKAEASYNAGRIAQQFSMMHLAVPLYEEALQHCSDEVPGIGKLSISGCLQGNVAQAGTVANFVVPNTYHDETNSHSNCQHTVFREAAFNLALILRESGADDLARDIMRKYLTF